MIRQSPTPVDGDANLSISDDLVEREPNARAELGSVAVARGVALPQAATERATRMDAESIRRRQRRRPSPRPQPRSVSMSAV